MSQITKLEESLEDPLQSHTQAVSTLPRPSLYVTLLFRCSLEEV